MRRESHRVPNTAIKTSTPFQNEQAADHVNVTLEKCYAKCTKSLITALLFNPTTMRKSDGICLIYVAGTGVVPFRIPPGENIGIF